MLLLFFSSSTKFQGHTRLNNRWFESSLRFLVRSQLSNPSDLPCFGDKHISMVYVCIVGNGDDKKKVVTRLCFSLLQCVCVFHHRQCFHNYKIYGFHVSDLGQTVATFATSISSHRFHLCGKIFSIRQYSSQCSSAREINTNLTPPWPHKRHSSPYLIFLYTIQGIHTWR